MNIEEAEEIIVDLREKLEELEQSRDDLSDEVESLLEEVNEYDRAISNRESVAEHAFKAGYNVIKKPMNDIKAWLNYKIEARL